jgi:hypothetical protein
VLTHQPTYDCYNATIATMYIRLAGGRLGLCVMYIAQLSRRTNTEGISGHAILCEVRVSTLRLFPRCKAVVLTDWLEGP